MNQLEGEAMEHENHWRELEGRNPLPAPDPVRTALEPFLRVAKAMEFYTPESMPEMTFPRPECESKFPDEPRCATLTVQDFEGLLAALRAAPQPLSNPLVLPDRMAIARIINPVWFHEYAEGLNNFPGQHLRYQNEALAKADAILSLPAEGGAREALEFYASEWRMNGDGDTETPGLSRTWMEPTDALQDDAGRKAREALALSRPLHSTPEAK